MPRILCFAAISLIPGLAFSQSSAPAPAFEIADVHVSAPAGTNLNNQFRRGPAMRGGRYELRYATMLDLVSIAYSVDADKVLGGPSWLETTRFDIVAKAPPNSTVELLKPALQGLLAERFKLAIRKEMKPLHSFALTAGKKPQLKEADGTGESGCKPQAGSGSGGPQGDLLMMSSNGGEPIRIALGPGMTIQFLCRNMTMAAFAEGLGGMMGASVGRNPVPDRTGLTGKWNFDVKWSLGFIGPAADVSDKVTVFEAVDKQLGLKLEPIQVPTAVIVVESANPKPSDNASDIAERLNVPPPPTEFDVAALKPVVPEPNGRMMFQSRVLPGGRVMIEGMSVRDLIQQAWGINSDMLIGAPAWTDTDRYDIIAKVASPEQVQMEDVWPLVRKLLTDRFQITTHTEERPANAYTLIANKPKLKKADPASRTHTENGLPDGSPRPANPALTRNISFQNTSMAQFADQLQRLAGGYLRTPVLDATGIQGGYDFTLSFSPAGMVQGGGRGGRGARVSDAGAAPAEAADTNGAVSLFEAVDKELGLKLEQQKRPVSVVVIDKIERTPLDN